MLSRFKLKPTAPSSFYGHAGNLGYVRFPELSAETLDDITAQEIMKTGHDWVEEVTTPEKPSKKETQQTNN